MADLPFPVDAKEIQALINQFMRLAEDMYQERLGGALVGDVFSIGADDIFQINTGIGLEKVAGSSGSSSSLAVKLSSTGGLQSVTAGLSIKLKGGGGLGTSVDGLYIVSAGTAGEISGMQVTVKDASNLYVWGGHIEINGSLYQNAAQITFATGSLTADTTYYLYVAAPATGVNISDADISLSTTEPAYDHAKGALYMTGDGTKRSGNWKIHTEA